MESEENVIGLERKGYPYYGVAQSLAVLFLVITQKEENVHIELGELAKELTGRVLRVPPGLVLLENVRGQK